MALQSSGISSEMITRREGVYYFIERPSQSHCKSSCLQREWYIDSFQKPSFLTRHSHNQNGMDVFKSPETRT